jgi:hypothetical protein
MLKLFKSNGPDNELKNIIREWVSAGDDKHEYPTRIKNALDNGAKLNVNYEGYSLVNMLLFLSTRNDDFSSIIETLITKKYPGKKDDYDDLSKLACSTGNVHIIGLLLDSEIELIPSSITVDVVSSCLPEASQFILGYYKDKLDDDGETIIDESWKEQLLYYAVEAYLRAPLPLKPKAKENINIFLNDNVHFKHEFHRFAIEAAIEQLNLDGFIFLKQLGISYKSYYDDNNNTPLLLMATKYMEQISSGDSLLHDIEEVDSKSEKIYEYLLEEGTNIDAVNCDGLTALMEAVKSLNYPLVKLLINNNADQGILSGEGKKAKDYLPKSQPNSDTATKLLILALKEEASLSDNDVELLKLRAEKIEKLLVN